MNQPIGEDGAAPRLYFGKYKGYVRRNDDPERRGRVRCYCPQVMGLKDDSQHWLGWAEPCLPWMGGINTLDFGPPYTKEQNGGVEVGVWIEFEGGQVDFPIWVGTWLPAPAKDSIHAQHDLAQAQGTVGGSLIENPPEGSEVEALNPPRPIMNQPETRMMAKAGRDIVIGSAQGGYIILGPHGISLVGPQVILNGRLMDASVAESVIG